LAPSGYNAFPGKWRLLSHWPNAVRPHVMPSQALQESGFLSNEQLRALDDVIAPLAPDQLVWVAGYLTGLAAAARGAPSRTAPVESPEPELTVLYGSQSG